MKKIIENRTKIKERIYEIIMQIIVIAIMVFLAITIFMI